MKDVLRYMFVKLAHDKLITPLYNFWKKKKWILILGKISSNVIYIFGQYGFLKVFCFGRLWRKMPPLWMLISVLSPRLS